MNTTAPDKANILFRPPELRDLDALLAIEQHAFETDRLSRRRMRHWIRAKQRVFLICEATGGQSGEPAGYLLMFLRKNSRAARLYSIAVSDRFRGQGIARELLLQGEAVARNHGSHSVQLEVRPNNAAAISLYQSLGYTYFGTYHQFYEDHQDALRFQKALVLSTR